MAKNILIFSDGTGQIGGLHPDQKLSNIYKMYRAMRPGPDSPISPKKQVCYYDAGLGAGEIGGVTFKRTRNILAAAVGSGIDENVIDCYEKIISYYEPGDKVLIFGFSRGAYTARAVANVMNLCGIPTEMQDGTPIPKHGKRLRKIASDAVNYVYNHGNGKPRGEQPYFKNREELGRRFRQKYKSFMPDAKSDVQGNVQPEFIGVFDTVAALGNAMVSSVIAMAIILSILLIYIGIELGWHWTVPAVLAVFLVVTVYWYSKLWWSQIKYFLPDPKKRLHIYNPFHWCSIWKNGHRAVWDMKNYDKYLDSDVGYARHALAIDEHRKDFPRVKWGMRHAYELNSKKEPDWLKQIWFAGCHSDVGGSYLESESRLSDIALDWMVEELKECVPDIQINESILVRSPDPAGLQHKEIYMFNFGIIWKKWKVKPRVLNPNFILHPSVYDRLKESFVPQLGEVKPYRPVQLEKHDKAKKYFK
ncbi:MAG: DUF2235 domain-containing protein [Rhizobiales bacterium]|nr:DUF2235 domain-containing protein [Hyphomicrobiales bacterium]